MRLQLWMLPVGLICAFGCHFDEPFVGGPPRDTANRANWLASVETSDSGTLPAQASGPVGHGAIEASHRSEDPPEQQVPTIAAVSFEEPVPADAEPPSLDDLEQMAMTNNPTVAQAQARVDALWGNWQQVGLLPNPVLGYQSEEMGDSGTLGQQGGYVGQRFVRGGKLGLNRSVAEHQIAQAQYQLAAQQTRVVTDVRIGFNEFLVACRQVTLAEELVAIATKAAEDTAELLRRGEVPRADLLRAEAEAASVNILLNNAHNERFATWRRLVAVVGASDLPMPEYEKATVQSKLEQAAARIIDHAAALDRLLAESPQIGAAYANVERARCAVQQACAQGIPDVSVQASIRHDNAGRQTLAGVQASMPIPIFNRNQGGVHQAQAQLIAAERAAHALELSLSRQFELVYQRYANARSQVQQYTEENDGILAKTGESLRLTTIGYEAGEFSSLEMLTAQRIFNQANIAYIDALKEVWSAACEIEGLLLTGSLDGP
jgi:cobalt-zinc-cadmium efflux system outer membrane protein